MDILNAIDCDIEIGFGVWLPPKSRPKIDKNKVDHYSFSVAL